MLQARREQTNQHPLFSNLHLTKSFFRSIRACVVHLRSSSFDYGGVKQEDLQLFIFAMGYALFKFNVTATFVGSTFEMRSLVRDYISLKHIKGDSMDLLAEFEENKVKQIHIIVQYLPLNVIHPEPNHESNFEPNNEHGPEPNPSKALSQTPSPILSITMSLTLSPTIVLTLSLITLSSTTNIYHNLTNPTSLHRALILTHCMKALSMIQKVAMTNNLIVIKKVAVSLVQNCINIKMMRMK
ncbi:hypothetical protein ACOSQ3_032328 [Xanthoceras sorbifolium]